MPTMIDAMVIVCLEGRCQIEQPWLVGEEDGMNEQARPLDDRRPNSFAITARRRSMRPRSWQAKPVV